jgi:hypothetical protein
MLNHADDENDQKRDDEKNTAIVVGVVVIWFGWDSAHSFDRLVSM